ncbi:hypothetical protein HMPREF1346_00419, partial [Enterococcus faecium 503]
MHCQLSSIDCQLNEVFLFLIEILIAFQKKKALYFLMLVDDT